jgi:methanogenic corrinoid protein MtbC1
MDEAEIRTFVELVLGDDDAAVLRHVVALQAHGTSVESIYLDLLAPAARALGVMWSDDTCGFVEVTVAMSRLQLVLRELSQMFMRDRAESALVGHVLLACTPGEQHSLGLFMVAEFFIRDGWAVRVGPPLSEERLLADVGAAWYDVIGFSVACDSRLDHLKREIARVRRASMNKRVLVMAGGRAFNEQPDLLARVGADASAANAELAPEVARQLLALS